jgi:hypothetical protein
MKTRKRFIAFILGMLMCFSMFTLPAFADQVNYPLRSSIGDLVADYNTSYITTIKQDPVTKMITATISIENGNPYEKIAIQGICASFSFDGRVAPYNIVTKSYLPGGNKITDYSIFPQYAKSLVPGWYLFGSTYIKTETYGGGVIGAKLTLINGNDTLYIQPRSTANIMELYFMPTSPNNKLDMNMVRYTYIQDPSSYIRMEPWFANGSRYVHMVKENALSVETFVASSAAFKIHVVHPAPNVSADNINRAITGYDPNTMEWADNINGPYYNWAPNIGYAAKTIYVRVKGDANYSLYITWMYLNRYIASDPVAVVFSASEKRFQLYNRDKLVADENTQYITTIFQNPSNKKVTVTISVYNGGSQESLHYGGMCAALTYSNKIAPYDPSTGTIAPVGNSLDINEFTRYAKSKYDKWPLFGFTYVERNTNTWGQIGGKLSLSAFEGEMIVGPGETIDIMELYFFPVNGIDTVNAGMFNYTNIVVPEKYLILNPWIAYGISYLRQIDYSISSMYDVVISPESFILQ